VKRRDFLKASAIAAATVAGTPLTTVFAETKINRPKIIKYNELGNTGLMMSDISFGTGGLPSASMILRAVDRGINYFDTAPDYGPSEKYIGKQSVTNEYRLYGYMFCSCDR
jgi:hypothetical protein